MIIKYTNIYRRKTLHWKCKNTDTTDKTYMQTINRNFIRRSTSSRLVVQFNKRRDEDQWTKKNSLLWEACCRLTWLIRMSIYSRRFATIEISGIFTFIPYSKLDVEFQYFRKSLRTHLLFVHEYIRNWKDVYDELNMQDRITFFRKCALYHTILDPCYISLRLGEKSKFVLQNGGYVSFDPNCEEGW